MSNFDDLFGDTDGLDNQNDGEIFSDGENQNPDHSEPNADGEDGDSAPVKIEPKKKTVRNPRLTLNTALLCGPRGIADMENYFKGIKFKGKGYEKDDLDAVMKRMQHWAHRMFPKYGLDDSLTAIENLGRKKQTQSYMNKYRMGLLEPEVSTVDHDEEDKELTYESNAFNQPLDPLDSMLEEQIAISRTAANFNTSGVGNLSVSERTFDSLKDDHCTAASLVSTNSHQTPSKPFSGLSEEMKAKIAANRQKAFELRKAKMVTVAAVPKSTNNTTEINSELTDKEGME